MPGIWGLSAVFFLGALFEGWWVPGLALPLFLVFTFFLFRSLGIKRFPLKAIVILLIWASIGAFFSGRIERDYRDLLPRDGLELTLIGVARTVDLARPNRILLQGRAIVLAGKRLRFPYKVWVASRRMGRKRERRPLEDLVGKLVVMPVKYDKGRFLYYGGGLSSRDLWYGWLYKGPYLVRKGIYYLFRGLSAKTKTLVSAVFLGVKTRGFFRLRDTFAKVGVAHILAISGLHLAILAMIVYLISRLFGLPEWLADVIVIVFVSFYAMMIPESASLLRASVMLVLFLFSRLLGRSWSIYDVLGLTVFLVFLIDPLQIFSLGFLMSVTAVLAILIGLSLLSRHSILDLWYVSFSASAGLAPIILAKFGCFPLVGWVITPVLAVLLMFLLFMVLIYVLSLGFVGGVVIKGLAVAMIYLVELLQDRSLPLCVTGMDVRWILLYYGVVLALVLSVGMLKLIKERGEKWT